MLAWSPATQDNLTVTFKVFCRVTGMRADVSQGRQKDQKKRASKVHFSQKFILRHYQASVFNWDLKGGSIHFDDTYQHCWSSLNERWSNIIWPDAYKKQKTLNFLASICLALCALCVCLCLSSKELKKTFILISLCELADNILIWL